MFVARVKACQVQLKAALRRPARWSAASTASNPRSQVALGGRPHCQKARRYLYGFVHHASEVRRK